MRWKHDTLDYSWKATDSLGYFYRVSKVLTPDFKWVWACAWTEAVGFRQSPHLEESSEEAKQRMESIASTEAA